MKIALEIVTSFPLYFSPQAKPQLLKTVPEELHHQLNGDEVLIAQDRNHGTGTRF